MGTINEQIRACLKPPADTTGTGIIAPEKSVPEKQSKGDQIPPLCSVMEIIGAFHLSFALISVISVTHFSMALQIGRSSSADHLTYAPHGQLW